MPGSVEIRTRHLARAVVLQLTGEFDVAGAPAVREQLLASVEQVRPPTAVVVDLNGLAVLSAAAVRVLSDITDVCRWLGVQVRAVIGPDRPTRAAAGLVGAIPVSDTIVSALERTALDEPRTPDGVDHAEQFASLTHSLLKADTVADVLTRVVDAATVVLPTADVASITLRDRSGGLHTPVRSDPLAERLDAAQYEFQEGPCYDSALPAGPGTATCDDLAAPVTPWPRFAPIAVGLGMAAVRTAALITDLESQDAAGALNVYSRTTHGLDELDRDALLLLATHASLAVSNTRAIDYAQLRETQLRHALDTRDVIGQAKGIIMVRRAVSAEQAFDILRRASQDLNVKLVDLARTLAERHGELDAMDR